MPTIIDNVELDETNVEFNYASDFVKHTDRLVYLTGKAGTGKTTFLKYLRDTTTKNTVILAPTGVAAINAGGQTIHSFFQLPFGPFVPNDKRLRTNKNLGDTDEPVINTRYKYSEETKKILDLGVGDADEPTIFSTFKYKEEKKRILEELELLVIDEISMVRSDTLDVIDRVLRVFRKKPNLPFGGVQVILIGDTFQLPPIADFEQWEILKDYYASPFFFNSKVVTENKPIYIELKKIYRQKEQEFIDLLNKIRVNQINDIELSGLNAKYDPTFSSKGIDNHIILSTTNAKVNQTNSTKLDELTTELKNYVGEILGTFPKDSKGSYVLPTEENLHLKVGAQVMILKNDTGEIKRYFNGKIGKILSLSDSKIVVEFSDLTKVQVEKTSWNNIQYTWNKEKQKIEDKVIGTFTQYPLRLAWSITVHKSQGLTFERVYADLGSAFEDGQVYVALSRCTTLSGLVLKTQIQRSKIRTNQHVIEFAKTETPSTLIVEELNSGKADFYYKKVREGIKSLDFIEAYNNYLKAIKFRNDTETDKFKKYFNITATKLGAFKEKFTSTLHALNETIIENEKHVSTIENIETEKNNHILKINEQNKAIKLLLEKISKSEKENTEKDVDIASLILEKKDLENKLRLSKSKLEKQKLENNELKDELGVFKELHNEIKIEKNKLIKVNSNINSTIKEQENKITKLEQKLQNTEAELARQKNIKWYQKLNGKK